MSVVFIGGSRGVSRLPPEVVERLNNIIESRFPVLVGDAGGADKAVQKHLLDSQYDKVTVFCSGETCRNNLGHWKTANITPSNAAKGFQFYAAKDREMARKAEFGLMIWDGNSAGTLLNVLRLMRAGKKAVLINVPEKKSLTFKAAADWTKFLSQCPPGLTHDLKERATPEEWNPALAHQPSLLVMQQGTDDELEAGINTALASGDTKTVVDLLGQMAKQRGMSQVAKDTGLAREGLYRALSAEGNPEFATVLKVINSIGLRLTASKSS